MRRRLWYEVFYELAYNTTNVLAYFLWRGGPEVDGPVKYMPHHFEKSFKFSHEML